MQNEPTHFRKEHDSVESNADKAERFRELNRLKYRRKKLIKWSLSRCVFFLDVMFFFLLKKMKGKTFANLLKQINQLPAEEQQAFKNVIKPTVAGVSQESVEKEFVPFVEGMTDKIEKGMGSATLPIVGDPLWEEVSSMMTQFVPQVWEITQEPVEFSQTSRDWKFLKPSAEEAGSSLNGEAKDLPHFGAENHIPSFLEKILERLQNSMMMPQNHPGLSFPNSLRLDRHARTNLSHKKISRQKKAGAVRDH